MSRLKQLEGDEVDADTAQIFDAIRGKLGMVPNLYRTAANHPAVLRALLAANDELAKGALDPRTREAIALAVAARNECDYCISAHAAISAGLNVDSKVIDDHLSGRSSDPRQQAILDLTGAIIDTKGKISDETFESARKAGLTDADIVETVGQVVVNIFTNYVNLVANTDIDFPVRAARN